MWAEYIPDFEPSEENIIGKGGHAVVYTYGYDYVVKRHNRKGTYDNELLVLHYLNNTYLGTTLIPELKYLVMPDSGPTEIVMKHEGTDLYRLKPSILKDNFYRIINQMIDCMYMWYKVLHISHCDIKPDNILYNSHTREIKIIDWSLASLNVPSLGDREVYTSWYRAPELFLNHEVQDYEKCEVWAMGATILHVYGLMTGRGYPLACVSKGAKSDEFQLKRITRLLSYVMDTPPIIKQVEDLHDLPMPEGLFNELPASVADLLHRMLDLDYRQRITMDEILTHPGYNGLYLLPDTPAPSKPLVPDVIVISSEIQQIIQEEHNLLYDTEAIIHLLNKIINQEYVFTEEDRAIIRVYPNIIKHILKDS